MLPGGWFSVAHREHADRLIYDRRPKNAVERRWHWVVLPHGSLFCQLILRRGFGARGSLHDLECYFFCLKQAPGAEAFNVVGRSWGASDFPKLHLAGPGPFRLCLAVQGMGDKNAVDIAQLNHECVLIDGDAQVECETLRYGAPVPVGPFWGGTYVDDHAAVQVGPLTKLDDPQSGLRDEEVVAKVKQSYQDTPGLHEATEKEILFQTSFSAWGTDVKGVEGKAGPFPAAECTCVLLIARDRAGYHRQENSGAAGPFDDSPVHASQGLPSNLQRYLSVYDAYGVWASLSYSDRGIGRAGCCCAAAAPSRC